MNSQALAASRAAIHEFEYQPLDENRNEIRVLTLTPPQERNLSSGAEEDDPLRGLVHCTLEHVSLDDCLLNYDSFALQLKPPVARRKSYESWLNFSNERHRTMSPPGRESPLSRVRSHSRYHRFTWGDYGAISYTWGDQSNKAPIVMNGTVVKIGRNLDAGLRALSADPDYVNGLKLWADAICINQRDLEERNRQVKRMGDIFGRALVVTIWLGEVPPGAELGMELLHNYISKCKDEESAHVVVDQMMDKPETRGYAIDSVEILVQITFWSRVWIIQEMCLGPFNPSLLLGKFRLSLLPFKNFLGRATNIRSAVRTREKVWHILKLIELAEVNQERLMRPRGEDDLELETERKKDSDNLGLLLMLGRLAGGMDLRDKLYGLMGMIPDYVTKHIEPDYAAPVEKVFCDFARALVTGFGSFDLVLAGTSETELTLPSWVPDLTDRWDPYLWGTDCDASAGRGPEFRLEDDGKVIVVKGFQVDVVDGTAPHLGWTNGMLDVWKPAVQPSIGVASPPADPKTAIVRTLHRDAMYDCTTGTTVLDIPWVDEPLDFSSARVQKLKDRGWEPVLRHANFVDLQKFRAQIDANFKPWGRSFRTFFPHGEVDDVPACTAPEEFTKSLEKHQGIIYPIITTGRGYFGTAIRPVKARDLIFIVLGCSAPVVMRPKGDVFEVISQCFVEGMMLGEAIQWLEAGAYSLRDVRIG